MPGAEEVIEEEEDSEETEETESLIETAPATIAMSTSAKNNDMDKCTLKYK